MFDYGLRRVLRIIMCIHGPGVWIGERDPDGVDRWKVILLIGDGVYQQGK